MYEAACWNEDSRMHTPMVNHNGEHIFIGDFVIIHNPPCHGKVLRILQDVRTMHATYEADSTISF